MNSQKQQQFSIYTIINKGDSFNDQMLAHPSAHEYDRFIPQRSYNNKTCNFGSPVSKKSSKTDSMYNQLIKKQLFENLQGKISKFDENQTVDFEFRSESSVAYFKGLNPNVSSPVKVLDVPKYRDDFYLNTLDWGSRGPIAAALDNEVFLYTPESVQQLSKAPFGAYISSLKMHDCILAVGLSTGLVEIFDVEKNCSIRAFKPHSNRVSAFTFVDNMLVSGSKDKSILAHDLRLSSTVIKAFNGHNGEVCSLKAKNASEKVFASGSSDGSAIVWDLEHGKMDQFKGHKGAVKALDWCPWKNGLLATGGGSNSEKYIKIWNTAKSKLVVSQPIENQISSLLWNEELRMLATSHGYTKNEINFWTLSCDNYSRCKLENQKSFTAHRKRVLGLAQSHDGSYLCSVGADQTMKFWCLRNTDSNPFKQETSQNKKDSSHDSFLRV